MRPTLRPGVRLLRRDPHSLQVGLDWPGVTVLAATEPLCAVAAAINGFRDTREVVATASRSGLDPARCADALAFLIESGAVVDADLPRPADVPEPTWAAWSLLAGKDHDPHLIADARRRHAVAVVGSGMLADALRSTLPVSLLRVVDDPGAATVVVAASDTEADRTTSNTLMHRSVPHLWVAIRDLVGIVGPFVLPGTTACLRCVDLARSERDPAWPALVDAAVVRPALPPPTDPVLTSLVAAFTVREVTLWAGGLPPQTYSHVVEIPYGSGPVESNPTTPHPRCGCGWLDRQDTMGA